MNDSLLRLIRGQPSLVWRLPVFIVITFLSLIAWGIGFAVLCFMQIWRKE